MNINLKEGKGRCQGTARLLVQPVQAVIELGAYKDVLVSVLNTVHHANRHGSIDDFIAVALPDMEPGRKWMQSGYRIELIGSESSLSILTGHERMLSLTRRGMLQDLEIREVCVEKEASGAAYVRDRNHEKYTHGWLRRNKLRAERRGKTWEEKDIPCYKSDREILRIKYENVIMRIRQVIGKITDDMLIVSTYGFSSPDHEAILPVYSDAVREYDDAV